MQCIPAPNGKPVTFGLIVLDNTGSSAARIRKVTLGGSVGLQALEAKAMLLHPAQTLIGGASDYPPGQAELTQFGLDWSTVHDAIGFEVPSGTKANLLIELQVDPGVKEGTASSTQTEYSVGKKTYVAKTTLSNRVVRSASC
jgi:hypothetical protein